ncbi:MAG: hypothetical protein HYZ21_00635 [Chloroflexi bacterium]|nr:hypothetical protein [Chloroflexota bacterium]
MSSDQEHSPAPNFGFQQLGGELKIKNLSFSSDKTHLESNNSELFKETIKKVEELLALILERVEQGDEKEQLKELRAVIKKELDKEAPSGKNIEATLGHIAGCTAHLTQVVNFVKFVSAIF